METNLDRFGRVVIPKRVRQDMGLHPGIILRVQEEGSRIVLEPVNDEPRVVRKEGVLVFSGRAVGDLVQAVRTHREARLNKVASGRRHS